MKSIVTIKYITLTISLVLLIIGLYLNQQKKFEIEKSVTAQGTVIGSIQQVSNGSKVYYHPVVSFTSATGKTFQFTSSSNGSSPIYQQGENVEILYNPKFPEKAEIKEVVSSWGTSGLCIFYSVVTFFIFLIVQITHKKVENIYNNGIRISTQYDSVQYSYNIKRIKLYQIHSKYIDPKTSEIKVFKSPKLLIDPTNFIKNNSIDVIIHRSNSKKYLMDLSFLGENYM